jgi:pyruvate/2-oxoglutarate dehydrogenase complex dihydrolipoamide dehydrogenase (E3) component
MKNTDYHTIIVGAGVAGICLAKGLSYAKKSVLIIEENLFGGTSIYNGCTPSKTLLSNSNYPNALRLTQSKVAEFANENNEIALKSLGVHCIKAKASFINEHTLSCLLDNGSVRNVTGKFIVIATGNKSYHRQYAELFKLTTPPPSLIIEGSDCFDIEMAEAFCNLGSKVTIKSEDERILKTEEPEVADFIQRKLEEKGVNFQFNNKTEKSFCDSMQMSEIGIFYNDHGIEVDKFGRTSKKNIFAIGDVMGKGNHTHLAIYQAKTVLKSLLYAPLCFSLSDKPIPRTLFSEHEVASIGLLESEAISLYGKDRIRTHILPFCLIPRAIHDGHTEGFIKMTIKKWGKKIVGASILGRRAHESLGVIAFAMDQNLSIRKIDRMITPYPTYLDGIKKIIEVFLVEKD